MATDDGEQPRQGRFQVQLVSVTLIQNMVDAFRSAVETITPSMPRLVPLFICLAAIPLLMLFSAIAGWTVWRSVPKGWNVPIYLQYGDGPAPYAQTAIQSLSSSQSYDISLHLTVPATDANYALGNFMVSLTVTNYWNTTIASVRKPTIIVPPASSLIPFVNRSPRLIEVTVPLVKSLITGVSQIDTRIELGRHDAWRSLGQGEGREISVYTAFLRGEVRPRGLRRIVSAFPLSLAIASAVAFFVVSSLVLIGFLIPSIQADEPSMEPAGTENPDAAPPEETLRGSGLPGQVVGEEGSLAHVYPTPEPELRLRSRRRSSIHATT